VTSRTFNFGTKLASLDFVTDALVVIAPFFLSLSVILEDVVGLLIGSLGDPTADSEVL
jgi:hypothetical protein